MPPYCAVRWLCRACGLVVVPSKAGRLVVGKPSLDAAVAEDYNVASVAATPAAAEALLDFVKRAVLGAYQHRERTEGGEVKPELEATFEKGRLKVLAPRMVHREVLTLLKTMAATRKPASVEELHVAYKPYELGMLNARGPVAPPMLPKGEVSFELAGAAAAEAAWALTSKSKANFFIDPWDEGLRTTKVTLAAEKMSVKAAAEQIAKQLWAEQCWFDGAWMFVRGPRRPYYEKFCARIYNVAGTGLAGSYMAGEAERQGKAIKLPEGFPYAVDRVGDKLLAAMPEDLQRPFEALMKWAAGAKWPGSR
jgi:hypothetical protein